MSTRTFPNIFSNIAVAAWLGFDCVTVVRVAIQSQSVIPDLPFALGFAFQCYYVLTRKPARNIDLSTKAVTVTAISVALPFIYLLQTPLNSFRETLILPVIFLISLLYFWSAISLRRSFAILPAARELVTSGPYRFVRHPIYTSYLLYDLSFAILSGSLIFLAIWFAELIFFFWRSKIEENLLTQAFSDYSDYTMKVQKRLIPFVL